MVKRKWIGRSFSHSHDTRSRGHQLNCSGVDTEEFVQLCTWCTIVEPTVTGCGDGYWRLFQRLIYQAFKTLNGFPRQLAIIKIDALQRGLNNFMEMMLSLDISGWREQQSWKTRLPSCPISVPSQENLMGSCVLQDAGADGPSLVLSSRAPLNWMGVAAQSRDLLTCYSMYLLYTWSPEIHWFAKCLQLKICEELN